MPPPSLAPGVRPAPLPKAPSEPAAPAVASVVPKAKGGGAPVPPLDLSSVVPSASAEAAAKNSERKKARKKAVREALGKYGRAPVPLVPMTMSDEGEKRKMAPATSPVTCVQGCKLPTQ